jgi:glycogen debranching enzyme
MIDLTQTPFSRRGSYFAVSRFSGRPTAPDGIYLRTVHGGAKTKEIFSLTGAGGAQHVVEAATPEKLRLADASGSVEICLDGTDTVLLRSANTPVHLDALLRSDYDLIVPVGAGRWQYICYASDTNLMLTAREGTLDVTNRWTGVKSDELRLRLDPDPNSGRSLLTIEKFTTSYRDNAASVEFDETVEQARADFTRWLAHAPHAAPELEATRELAAYVNWSSVVAPTGHITRPVMFMSKNWMTNVWAWDHCFNAMALTADPEMAMNQFLCIFDFQDDNGAIPDCFNDAVVSRNFTKPAVHGWALRWMMERAEFDASFLLAAYEALAKWTEWWFADRDYRRSGFPAYNHGNDSGWDNSTAFSRFVPIESPDQIAFLVLQLEALSELAGRLERPAEAERYRHRSQALLTRLVEEFWVDSRFVARHALSGEVVECDSLLMYIPLVLGERLPADIFDTLATGLETNDFLTEFGLATESTSSAHYESDGYWRGPIWAPSTLIIVDGLAKGGRADLAGEIARRFCALAAGSGMAENYDAMTGAGLRDRAYTWTASVFLILASEYASRSASSGT